jgi:ATP-dependent RNA helicase DHX29
LAPSIADVEASLRARILAYAEEDPEAESEALVEETANQVYAGLKLQLSEIQRAQGVAKRFKAKSKGAPLPETKQDELMEMQCLLLKKVSLASLSSPRLLTPMSPENQDR